MIKNRGHLEKVLMVAAFGFFVLITCHKLTNAPLWFDETIEYWFSKVMFGSIPFDSKNTAGSVNMYERIITTFQPPLYNFIMFFWLKVSDSEWWFRFFGVCMGFAGNIGIYKAVRKTSNGYIAAMAVFSASCVFRLVYYWQECAEYCLMLGTLCWTVYLFISYIQEQNLRNSILLVVFSVLSVYSQYGAVFPVAAMLITALIYVLMKKDKKHVFSLLASYGVAFVIAALPLILFFLRVQISNQRVENNSMTQAGIENNIVYDFLKNLMAAVKWNLFSYYDNMVTFLFASVFLLALILVLIFGRKVYVRLLAVTDILTWMLYYTFVKLGLYAYGDFGSRYDLFLIPLWIVSIFCFVYELYEVLMAKVSGKHKTIKNIYIGVCAGLIICFMITGWNRKLKWNWSKEDMRGAVEAWIDAGAQISDTIVYYAGDSGFAFYIRQNADYSAEMERNVNYQPWMRDRTIGEYSDYIDSLYGKEWPPEIYIIASHTKSDLDIMVTAFTDKGYKREDLWDSGSNLIRLTL